MRIEIEKVKNIKRERKTKLLNIETDLNKSEIFQYSWKTFNSSNESTKDFKIFCLLIAKDLVLNKFNSDSKENNEIDYSLLEEFDKEMTSKNIDKVILKINESK